MRRFLPVLALIISLCLAAGCTSAPPVHAAPPVQSMQAAPAVSINAAPVQYADVNGVRLAYREFGSGDPLLVIVGFGVTMEQANETAIGIFASKYHVFLYDHRGMGHSSAGNVTPSIGMYADDAAGLMQVLGHDSMHVYGTSMGSFIAQELALGHPERVRKMILDSPSYSIQVPEIRVLKVYLESVAVDPASLPGLRDEARAILAWNGTEERLPAINKDVMLVVGTEDTITPVVLSVRMAEKINSSWLVRFRSLPHAGGGVAPEEYGRTTLFFLGTNESFGK